MRLELDAHQVLDLACRPLAVATQDGRDTWIDYYVRGLLLDEIAAQDGISRQAVSTRLETANTLVRAHLQPAQAVAA